MEKNEMIRKTFQEFSSLFSYLNQSSLPSKDELVNKLMILDEQLIQVFEEEIDDKVKRDLMYPINTVERFIDDLEYIDLATDRFVVEEMKNELKIDYKIFSRLYRDSNTK